MKRDLPKFLKEKAAKGFTLIELLVVIAILGVLAVVLITVIDPIDKIDSANDAAAISTIRQLGQGNDAYAANHENTYVGANPTTFAAAVTDLNAQGEVKQSTVTNPTGYTYYYFTNPANCTTALSTCLGYAFAVNLEAKGNQPGGVQGYYLYKDGLGCKLTSAVIPTLHSSLSCP